MPVLPQPLVRAARRSRDAEAAAAEVADRRADALASAAEKRAALAEAIRRNAPTLGVTIKDLSGRVARRMGLSSLTVKKELYEYPHRADVLSVCLDVLAEVATRPSPAETARPGRPAPARAAA